MSQILFHFVVEQTLSPGVQSFDGKNSCPSTHSFINIVTLSAYRHLSDLKGPDTVFPKEESRPREGSGA